MRLEAVLFDVYGTLRAQIDVTGRIKAEKTERKYLTKSSRTADTVRRFEQR